MYMYHTRSSAAHASVVSRANHCRTGSSEKVGSHQLLAFVSCRRGGDGVFVVLSPDSERDVRSLEGESTQQMARVPELHGIVVCRSVLCASMVSTLCGSFEFSFFYLFLWRFQVVLHNR